VNGARTGIETPDGKFLAAKPVPMRRGHFPVVSAPFLGGSAVQLNYSLANGDIRSKVQQEAQNQRRSMNKEAVLEQCFGSRLALSISQRGGVFRKVFGQVW